MRCFLAALFTLTSIPWGNTARAKDTAGICSNAIETVTVDRPDNQICTCSSNNVSDGAAAQIDCTGCQYCSLGICAKSTLTSNVAYSLDGNTSILKQQCYEFHLGEEATFICLVESSYGYCDMFVDHTSCRQCEYTDCGDGRRRPLLNCTNLDQGEVFDLCQDITVRDRYTPFFAIDSRFDTTNCTSSSGVVTHWPLLALGFSVLALLSQLTF